MPSTLLLFLRSSLLLALLCLWVVSGAADLQRLDEQQQQQDVIVLVARGEDPRTAKNRVIIPQARNGQLPLLPCLISGVGIYENGQTFTKGNFHYNCKNGTAEVIGNIQTERKLLENTSNFPPLACVADDMSVIQIGRTFLKNGMRHKCGVKENTVTYEQRSTCYENGVNYDIGDTFRNASFQLVCKENGVAVLGCFLQQNSTDNDDGGVILLGESRILGKRKHSCELTENGRIRYVVTVLGCRNGTEEYRPGQIWADQHIRYQCSPDGVTRVLGCVDEAGLFIELGHDILMGGTVHRCYKVKNVTYYHRFQCDKNRSLTECIHSNFVPKEGKNM